MGATAFTAIVNMALGHIGAKAITDLAANEPNAIKANAILTYFLEEVIQAKNWHFAKTRVPLTRVSILNPLIAGTMSAAAGGSLAARTYSAVYTLASTNGETLPSPEVRLSVAANNRATFTLPSSVVVDKATGWNLYVDILGGTAYKKQNTSLIAIATTFQTEALTGFTSTGSSYPLANSSGPQSGFKYAYAVPADYLRLYRQHENQKRQWPALTQNDMQFYKTDEPVLPANWPYIFEALSVGTFCLMTDYLDQTYPVIINYIRKVTSEALMGPKFKMALAYRLAQALAIAITESIQKESLMELRYRDALQEALEVNECEDFQEDETGNYSWEYAGREWT